jgi:hypothetical protein
MMKQASKKNSQQKETFAIAEGGQIIKREISQSS